MVLSGASSAYLEDLYERYLRDPGSVETGWRAFFAGIAAHGQDALTVARKASWGRPILLPIEDEIAVVCPVESGPCPELGLAHF